MKMPYKNIIGLLALMGLLAGAGYWGLQSFKATEAEASPEKPAPQGAPDTVRFAPDSPQLAFVQVKPVEVFPEPLIGALNARIAYDDNHTARVFSAVAGRVVKIEADAGQHVKTGAALLSIDSPDFAQGASDSLKAEADLKHKQEVYERAKALLNARGIAQKDLEAAEADWRQAQAEAERARARMKNLYSSGEPEAHGRFILRAPIGGVISERQVNAGSEVAPDAPNPLFVITDMDRVWVAAELPEQQIGKLKTGQAVSIEVAAYPGEAFTGKITVIGEALDPVMRRVQVRCEVDNRDHKLKPEMYARITPVADANTKVPRVPNAAIFTQGLYSYIFVEKSPGVLQRRRVALGLQDADYTYIKDGLNAGERIVTSGALLLNSELGGRD